MKNILILVLLMITFNTKAQTNEIGQNIYVLEIDSVKSNIGYTHFYTYLLSVELTDYDYSILNNWECLDSDEQDSAKVLWLFTDKLDVEVIDNQLLTQNE